MLTNYERETIINFNEAEPTAYIFTYNKSWQKHIEGKLKIKPKSTNGHGGKEYELPKKMIKMPRAPKKVSEETRKRLADMRSKRVLSRNSSTLQEKSKEKKVK